MSERAVKLQKLKEFINDEKIRWFEYVGVIVRADEEHRSHMGLRPGKFEEYVSRSWTDRSNKIEKAIQAYEKEFPDHE
jgi:hypothetical protein